MTKPTETTNKITLAEFLAQEESRLKRFFLFYTDGIREQQWDVAMESG